LMLQFGRSAPVAAQITEYPIPTASSGPTSISVGPDGALWFVESGATKIGRITTNGIVTEYPVPPPAIDGGAVRTLTAITTGPDGALWFGWSGGLTQAHGDIGAIGRITTSGAITEYANDFIIDGGAVTGITTGPDGALWFGQVGGLGTSGAIGRLTIAGTYTNYTLPLLPGGIAAGPDGALWFSNSNVGGADGAIGQITTAGAITEYPILDGNSAIDIGPYGVTAGPDGALWFTEANAGNSIGRITTSGAITQYPADNGPIGIAAGPDGALWFTEPSSSKIGRITTAGAVTEFSTPTGASQPNQIVAGPDGRLWFTEQGANRIGAFAQLPNYTLSIASSGTSSGTVTSNPSGISCGSTCSASYYSTTQITLTATVASGSTFAGWSGGGCSGTDPCTVDMTANITVTASFVQDNTTNIALAAAVLPLSRSVEVGATATAFATLIDAGPGDASTCSIAPATSIPASFTFQTTDPTTNALTGTANMPVNIAQGASQSFVIAFTPTAAFSPTNVLLTFGCANANPAPETVGIDTLNLSASMSPVPDIVALAASADPGYVDIPGATGTGDFAVATVNLGSAAQITASANTGTANLPVTLLVCQTDPTSGNCLASPAINVTTTIVANATPTFGVFVTGSAAVPDSPGVNRVFVQFIDAGGVLRGETSVAVRTQ
jgi:virginiamycin B lyase